MTPSKNSQYYFVEYTHGVKAKNKLQEEIVRCLKPLSNSILRLEDWPDFLARLTMFIDTLNSVYPKTTPVRMEHRQSHHLYFYTGQGDIFVSLHFQLFEFSDDANALDIIVNTVLHYG